MLLEVCSGSTGVLSELMVNACNGLLERREVQDSEAEDKPERRLGLGRKNSGEVSSQVGRLHGSCAACRPCDELVHGLTTQRLSGPSKGDSGDRDRVGLKPLPEKC